MHTISIDKDIYVALRRGHPRYTPNLITIEQLSVPLNPKAYYMIE